MPSYFPEGDTALPFDNELRSLQKLVSQGGTGGGGGGGTPIGGNYHIVGTGTPAIDVPSTGYNEAYNDIGNTWVLATSGWAQIT